MMLNCNQKQKDFCINWIKKDKDIIIKKIEKLREDPRIGIPLVGNLAGLWKLRIGKYRTIYSIRDNELIVIVIKIGPRKNIYDDLRFIV